MVNKIISRLDLPALITTEHPIGVELGVAHGSFSKKIINNFNFKTFFMIDWWKKPTHVSNYLKIMEYSVSNTNTDIYVLRGAFEEFVNIFNDGFFDFIYVDGLAHTGQLEGQTIRDWLPKIKPGGLFSGHDYCEQYPKTKHYVDLIAEEHGFNVNVIGANDGHPSWYYTKK